MRSKNCVEYESVDVLCTKCGEPLFEVRYEENWCEAGSCLRLFCKACGGEMDFGMRHDACSESGRRLIERLRKAKQAKVVK